MHEIVPLCIILKQVVLDFNKVTEGKGAELKTTPGRR